jgi:hypothetical protein
VAEVEVEGAEAECYQMVSYSTLEGLKYMPALLWEDAETFLDKKRLLQLSVDLWGTGIDGGPQVPTVAKL